MAAAGLVKKGPNNDRAATCRMGKVRFCTDTCFRTGPHAQCTCRQSVRALTSAMPHNSPTSSFDGRLILFVQRSWVVAHGLAKSFEAKGASVLIARDAQCLCLANDPRLSVAVLDSASHDLGRQLKAKDIPFVLYTGHRQTDDAPIIHKPALTAALLARVQELLSDATGQAP